MRVIRVAATRAVAAEWSIYGGRARKLLKMTLAEDLCLPQQDVVALPRDDSEHGPSQGGDSTLVTLLQSTAADEHSMDFSGAYDDEVVADSEEEEFNPVLTAQPSAGLSNCQYHFDNFLISNNNLSCSANFAYI